MLQCAAEAVANPQDAADQAGFYGTGTPLLIVVAGPGQLSLRQKVQSTWGGAGFVCVVGCRTELLEIAALGPAAGTAASLALILVGLVLVRFGVGGIPVDPVAFEDSFLMGILGEPPCSSD